MGDFLDELCDALSEGEPEVFTVERELATGDAKAPRLHARLTWREPGEKTLRFALDASCLDTKIEVDAVERFAGAASALKLKRPRMLSGVGASEAAIRAAGARGVRLVFVYANPRAKGKQPYACIYPVINVYELVGAKPAKALTKAQWQKLHMKIEDDQRRALFRDASGATLASFDDLVLALPLDASAAFIGKGFSGKESAQHTFGFEGATLVVPSFPEIALDGVKFDYWIGIRAIDARTRAEAFASLLLDKLIDD